MVLLFIISLVINLIICNIIGKLGREKKIGFNTAFTLSFFLSPIIGALIVIASVPLTMEEREREVEKRITLSNSQKLTEYMAIALLVLSVIGIICVCLF